MAKTSTKHPAQFVALAIGVVYLLVGLAGFLVTGFDGFAEPSGDLLLVFEVNPLHNLVHLVIGAAGITLWGSINGAMWYGILLAVAYLPTFLLGLAVADSDDTLNFLALNQADNWLHIASAIAGIIVAAWAWPKRKA